MPGTVTITVSRRTLIAIAALMGLIAAVWLSPQALAQRTQEDYGDKFKIAEGQGGVAIAASSDGRYVFVAGKNGVLVSDDYGKTGSWIQTVRMK